MRNQEKEQLTQKRSSALPTPTPFVQQLENVPNLDKKDHNIFPSRTPVIHKLSTEASQKYMDQQAQMNIFKSHRSSSLVGSQSSILKRKDGITKIKEINKDLIFEEETDLASRIESA